MSIRNLDAIFRPRSVALIGASNREHSAGCGFGCVLMQQLIDYARARGLSCLFGDFLAENGPMLGLCAQLGFKLERMEAALFRAALPLTSGAKKQ